MNIQDIVEGEVVVDSQELFFTDIFNLADVQHLQDLFADAHGVASIITDTEGNPITKPSNFTHLCENIIRKTEKGCANCFKSDAVIGRHNPSGAVIQSCLSGGLWDAGASINVGGKHIANWLIGQVRNEQVDEQIMMQYADEIGANKEDFKAALNKVPFMSSLQFHKIANLLFVFANELSEKGYSNLKLTRQIAEKENAIANLQESEERYRSLMNNLDAGVVVHAPDTSIVMNNTRASELLGLSNDLIKGKKAVDPAWKFIDERNIPLPIEDYPVNRIVNGKKPVKDQILGICQPGKSDVIWVSVNGFPMLNTQGDITEIVISFIDITEQMIAVNQLVVSEQKLKEAQRIAHMGNWELNNETHELLWSEEIYRIFDCEPHEFEATYQAFLDFIHPDDREIVNVAYLKSLETKKEYQVEHRVLTKNNQIKYVREKCLTNFNEQGKPLNSFGIVLDITEQKQIEIELAESTERFKALHNASFGGIAIHDKGIILECNQGLAEMTGYSLNELIGMDGLMLVVPEHREMVINKIVTSYEKPYEASGLRKNGEQFPMRLQARNIPYKGKNVRTVEFRDITERKEAEQALISAKEKAEESDHLKSAFLANMSHEIRTPMNGILGFSALLKEPGLTGEEQQNYIRIIEKSGARMLNTINNIVDISKIEAGLMKVDLKEANLNEQIEYIHTFFKPEVEKKGMNLLFNNSLSPTEALTETDPEKIYAILTNLVKNAIKYTNEGSIELGCDKRGEYFQFYVRDTGIGIEKNRQEAIFERFIQADIFDKHAYQGSGLGLSISKAYVEMLGGKIWVDSEPGKGSIFYFTIPCNKVRHGQNTATNIVSQEDESIQLKNLKILIADDDETSDFLITRILKKHNHELLHAKTGIETIEVCRNNPRIDLVLMDIRMPGMNGYDATRQIRQFNETVIIIAQTAFALSGDREKAIEAGCNEYLSKPIDKEELLKLMKKYFTNKMH